MIFSSCLVRSVSVRAGRPGVGMRGCRSAGCGGRLRRRTEPQVVAAGGAAGHQGQRRRLGGVLGAPSGRPPRSAGELVVGCRLGSSVTSGGRGRCRCGGTAPTAPGSTGRRRHRAITSLARSRYAAAPDDVGAHVVIGWPATVVSGNRTVRLDDGLEHGVAEGLDHPAEHLAAVHRPGVVHRGEDAVDLQRRVQPLLDLVDRVDQQGHPAQGEELALQRDDHALRGGERVDRQQARARAGSR